VTPARAPAFEVRVALRATDGQVRARTRLCWAQTPSAVAVLDVLLRRVMQARRGGLALVVEGAPAELASLLALTGVSAPDGPLLVMVGMDASDGPGTAGAGAPGRCGKPVSR
jgi:hypothetical protein